MLIHIVEIILYLLAIVLASYALWERFPAGTHPAQRLALAGALLTLFLTYFVTSLRIDDLKDDTGNLSKAVSASPQELRLRSLKEATDAVAQASLDLLNGERDDVLPLHENGDAILSEDEGIRIIGLIVQRLALDAEAKNFQINAVSVDPSEFKNSRTFKGYEEALKLAAERMAKVQRIYVLPDGPDKVWSKIPPIWSQGEIRPSDIEDQLRSQLDLNAIADHYKDGIQCTLAPGSILQGSRSDYDLILVTKESNVILGANRITDGLHIVWNEAQHPTPTRHETTRKWLRAYNDLVHHPGLITLPRYVPRRSLGNTQ